MNTCFIDLNTLSLCVRTLHPRRAAARRRTRRAGKSLNTLSNSAPGPCIGTRGKRHSKERQSSWRNCFGHFLRQVTRGHQRSNFTEFNIFSTNRHITREPADELQRRENAQWIAPRRAGGCLNTPSGFSQISKKKQRRGAPPFFGTPVHTFVSHILLKFQTQVTQGRVTRSRQMTSPHRKFKCSSCYTEWLIILKLSAIDIRNSIYKMYISVLWYRWPTVRSILRALHYKSMGENWKEPFLDETRLKHSNIGLQVDWTLWIRKLRPVTPHHIAKSFQTMKGHQQFFGNNVW